MGARAHDFLVAICPGEQTSGRMSHADDRIRAVAFVRVLEIRAVRA